MKKLEFVPSPVYSLSNVAFAQFFNDFLERVGQIDPLKLTDVDLLLLVSKLTDLNNGYLGTIALSTSSPITKVIAEADSERDWSYRRLNSALRLESLSPNPQNRQAAQAIRATLRPYGPVPRLSLEEETQAIESIIGKLEGDALQQHVRRLQLEPYLSDLKQKNEALKERYYSRLTEKIQKGASDNKHRRIEIVDVYNLICSYVLTMARMEKGEQYELVYRIINALRDAYSAQLARMAPRKSDDGAEV